jgi:hypothetical protein
MSKPKELENRKTKIVDWHMLMIITLQKEREGEKGGPKREGGGVKIKRKTYKTERGSEVSAKARNL